MKLRINRWAISNRQKSAPENEPFSPQPPDRIGQRLCGPFSQKVKLFLPRYLAVLLLALFLAAALPAYAENPDRESEPEGTESVTHETSVYYTIKKGDTLWGISKRFNDNPHTWPEMWRENSREFSNPHLIYPGQKIRLFIRTDTDRYKGEEETRKAESVASLEMEEKGPAYYYSKIEGIGFMRETPIKPHGYIFKVKGFDKMLIGKGDEIYIKEDATMPLAPGGKYFTYRMLKPSILKKILAKKDPKAAKKVRKILHTQYYITGTVEISSKKEGYATATVSRAFKTIRLKDFLMPYTDRSPSIPLTESVKGLTGKVIISEENEGMFGEDKVAFIDKGKKNGVLPGQVYNIFYPEEKDSSELVGGARLFVPVDFAKLLVLHSENTTATVLITSSEKSISPGDTFRYPDEEATGL